MYVCMYIYIYIYTYTHTYYADWPYACLLVCTDTPICDVYRTAAKSDVFFTMFFGC